MSRVPDFPFPERFSSGRQDYADGPREGRQFLRADHERRHQVHDILERPDPDTLLDEPRSQGMDVHAWGKLDDTDRPADSHIDDPRESTTRFQSHAQARLDRPDL